MDSQTRPKQAAAAGKSRIESVDLARGVALLAMTVYHFTWDLEFFGYAHAGLTAEFGWKLFARCIASGFLFLVGVSLVLGHGEGIRWRGFWRRFAMVAGAAAAISAVTFIALPAGGIFFGILHQIAFASLVGLPFLRLPPLLTLAAGAAVIAAPVFLRSELFDHPVLWWIGLSSADPRSNDYVPVFPWFGAVLAGIGIARIARDFGLFARLAALRLGNWSQPVQFIGRHSLAYYLIHQPLMLGGVWLFAQMFPPTFSTADFLNSCQAECVAVRDSDFCTRYCACFLGVLDKDGNAQAVLSGAAGAEVQARLSEIATQCTAETDGLTPEGGAQ